MSPGVCTRFRRPYDGSKRPNCVYHPLLCAPPRGHGPGYPRCVDILSRDKFYYKLIYICLTSHFLFLFSILLEMNCFAEQCSRNLQLWRSRVSELTERSEKPNYPPVPYRATSPPPPPQASDFMTVFPLSLPSQFFRPFSASASRAPSEMDAESVVGGGFDGTAINGDTMRMDGIESSYSHKESKNGTNGGDYRDKEYTKPTSIEAESAPSSSRSPSPVTFTTAKSTNNTTNNSINNNNNGSTTTSPYRNTTNTSSNNTHPLPPAIGIPTFTTPDYSLASPTGTSGGGSPSPSASPSPRSEFAPRTPGGRSVFSSSTSTYGSGGYGSINGSTNGSHVSGGDTGTGTGAGTDASIRAAYKLSVRRKKSFHRNSWAPGPPPPPVPPLPQSAMGTGSGSGNMVNSRQFSSSTSASSTNPKV